MISLILAHSIRFLRRGLIRALSESTNSYKPSNCCACPLVPELEALFCKQVTTEFNASFTYLAMASFFNRQCVSLPGCHNYFFKQFEEEREHAQKLINYLSKRGNNYLVQAVNAPGIQEWDTPLNAFKDALDLERCVSQDIFDLHKAAEEADDICACVLLEDQFINEQIEEYDRLSRHITELERIGDNGLGVYLFDRYLLQIYK